MARVLIVHHTVSPSLAELLDIVMTSAEEAGTQLGVDLDLITRPALTASALDVLEADALIMGSPINIGYMSGALKHFFDGIYYPCLYETNRLPVGYYLHGNNDAAGAVKSVDQIVNALKWRPTSAPVIVTTEIDQSVRKRLCDLAAVTVFAATEASSGQSAGS